MRLTSWPARGPRRSSTGNASRRTNGPPPGPRRPSRAAWLAASFPALVFGIALGPALARAEGDAAEASPSGRGEVPRLASRTRGGAATSPTTPADPGAVSQGDPVARAKLAIADCREKFASVRDYTCTFLKRERVGGRLMPRHAMHMKARNEPLSIYFKFQTPNKGREAIYVAGRHGGKVLAHDVGIGRLIAGTMILDPRGSTAMEDCRHPITEAGIGALVETVARHWSAELTPEESKVSFHPDMKIGKHACTMIESVHPERRPNFLHHKVRLYVDREHGLPIRFEAYDWPKHPGAAPELVEEYTYLDLKINVGLTEADFDPGNKAYSFGRF